MNSLLQDATDISQYDDNISGWQDQGVGLDAPIPSFFWEYISEAISWDGKTVLDVGTGSGWLIEEVVKRGAISAEGIEPSKANISLAKKHFPDVKIHFTNLQDFETEQKFDIVTALMSFVHIADLNQAFKKISGLLPKDGVFACIVPDYMYFRIPRFGYDIQIEDISDDEYVNKTKRPYGTFADIVRRMHRYEIEGNKFGLKLVEDIPIKPTENYIRTNPKYEGKQDITILHLLIFHKE